MKIKNLSLSLAGKRLLHSLDFTLPEPGISLILGPNGAGKTLFLRCLTGLLEAEEGTICFADGRDVRNLPLSSIAEELAWVPLSASLPFAFKVSDLLLMGRYRHHLGYPKAKDRAIAEQVLERMQLTHFRDRIYNSLSRGEQTKVDIARALAAESRMIVFDEPFANLDIDACLQVHRLFRELKAEGKTLILSHHDLHSVQDLATHVVLLRDGRLVAAGTTADVFNAENIRKSYQVNASFVKTEDNESVLRFHPL